MVCLTLQSLLFFVGIQFKVKNLNLNITLLSENCQYAFIISCVRKCYKLFSLHETKHESGSISASGTGINKYGGSQLRQKNKNWLQTRVQSKVNIFSGLRLWQTLSLSEIGTTNPVPPSPSLPSPTPHNKRQIVY